jgi:hypothetical protein
MVIANDNTPGWIERQNREKEETKRLAEEAEERRRSEADTIRAVGPDFWSRFVLRVKANIQALPTLQGAELVGSVSTQQQGREELCSIHVNRQSVPSGPALSHLNLWYASGAGSIRCYVQDHERPDFHLVHREGVVHVSHAGGLYTAEDFADYLVSSMSERVKARRSA